MSQHFTFRPRNTPQHGAWQPEQEAGVNAEPLDQWAVLRHEVEVEVEDMKRQEEQAWAGWRQRDTEDEAGTTPTSARPHHQEQHHIDIVVAGVGGGGMNAIDRMISAHVRGVRFIAMNTDAQVLTLSQASQRLCLGQHSTKGLGAGGSAAVGTRAASESASEIQAALGNANLVFITAGMGGGTGTGAAPIVASLARKMGALTIGIVTLPFAFEGAQRRRIAEQGLLALSKEIDALITVPNDRLLATAEKDCSLAEAFLLADDILRQGVQGIAEVINVPGMVNVDFADVRNVLSDAGSALMSIGQGIGRNRAQRAAEQAIAGGFLNVTIRGAKRVLFNISGGEDMTLYEVNEVAESIGQAIDTSADITFGAVIDPTLHDTIRVTLIAAGMEQPGRSGALKRPVLRSEQSHATSQRTGSPYSHSPAPQAEAPQSATPGPLHNAAPQPKPSLPAAPQTPAQPPRLAPGAPQPVTRADPTQYPARQRRSLEDLRGIRSMGRRQEAQRGRSTEDGNAERDAADIPGYQRKSP